MKRVIATTLAAAVPFTAGLTQAAGADLAVKGKLEPGACNLIVGNGGAFDLGAIRTHQLHADKPYSHWVDEVQLSIDCKTPSKVTLSLMDNRADSHFGGTVHPGGSIVNVYGLGKAGGKGIGEYTSAIRDAAADGLPVDLLSYSPASAIPWQPGGSGLGVQWLNDGTHAVGFAPSGGTEPAAFSSISATLYTDFFINKSSELDLSQEIEIDGSATLELVYL